MKLKGKVIVITGASSGIGLATAKAAAIAGASLIICGRNADRVNQAVNEIRDGGGRIESIRTDVADPSDLAVLLEFADSTFGKVDIWINNAGVGTGTRPLTELSAGELAGTVNTNLTGTAEACRIVIPYMLRQGHGIICNTTGRGADYKPQGGTAIYAATKAAVLSLTKSLAQENLGQNISIHAVSPGLALTGLHKSRMDDKKNPVLAARTRAAMTRWATPLGKIGEYFVEVVNQEPGRATGRYYMISAGKTVETDLLEGLERHGNT